MTADVLEMFSTLPKYFNGFMHDSFELFCFGCSCDSVGDDVDVDENFDHEAANNS